MRAFRVLVVGMAAAACGGGGGSKVPADSGIDAPVLRVVSGTYGIRWVTPTGEVDTPIDLSSASVYVLSLPDFTSHSGFTNADGTFSVAFVPEGHYLLQLGTAYLDLIADTVDLGFDALGRPDGTICTQPTTLKLDITNLATWQASDELQLQSRESGTAAYGLQAYATAGAPTVGATSLSGFSYDLSLADYPAAINGSTGDRLTMTQLATQTDGTRSYRTVARSLTFPSFNIVNGETLTMSGAFTDVTPAATLDVTWDRPAFEAELAAHWPGAQAKNYSTFAISALPEAATRGYYHPAADVVVFAPGYTTDTSAVAATWPYGDPYPADWTRVAWHRYYRYRYIQLAGATPVAVFAKMLTYRDLSTVTAQSPLVPLVGTIVAPTVNGMDALANTTIKGVGATPTLAWTAPTLGTATRYDITIDLVAASGGATVLQRVGFLSTSATQITVPPGRLATGSTYVFEIEVVASPNVDLAATPSRLSLPAGYASITTAMVTP